MATSGEIDCPDYLKREYNFAGACRYWGYRPHELDERPDRDFLIAQASMFLNAESKAREIMTAAAEARNKNG